MTSAVRKPGVSLLEVIIAIVVLGVVAALTIPRFSSGASVADEPALLRERLQVLRVAIERYYQDHNALPAQNGDGRSAAATEAAFSAQLTGFTDETGWVGAVRDATCRFGPYLRDGIPLCPVPPRVGQRGVCVRTDAQMPAFAEEAGAAGWVYDCATGLIAANSDAIDPAGRAYAGY